MDRETPRDGSPNESLRAPQRAEAFIAGPQLSDSRPMKRHIHTHGPRRNKGPFAAGALPGGILLAAVLLCAVFFPLSAPSPAAARNRTPHELLAVGSGRIVDGNLARAKRDAIGSGLAHGLETYLGLRLGDQGMVTNFERLVQDVLPYSKEVIQNFVILAEVGRDDEYKILMRITINENLLERKLRDAGAVEVKGPALKVLVMVGETAPGRRACWWRRPEIQSALGPAEVSLYRVLQDRGFEVLDRLRGVPDTGIDKRMKKCDVGPEALTAWGRLFGADVVVYGSLEQDGETEISLDLSALAVASGTRICGASELAPLEGRAFLEALNDLAGQAVARLSPCILREASGAPEAKRILVTLKGVKNFRQVRLFRDFLKTDVPGVRSVRQRRVGRTYVTVEVTYEEGGASFAEQVSKSLDDLPLKVDFIRGGEEGYIFSIRE